MIQWMSNLFTLQYGPYFVAGFSCAWGWHWLNSVVRGRPMIRIKWNWLAMMLAVVVFMWVAVTAQRNADCVHQFNEVLRVRSKITEDNDKWSAEQRTALAQWLFTIINPPPEIAKIQAQDPSDPRVNAWGVAVTKKYSDIVQQAQREQDENFAERQKHPLPNPTCGD